MSERAGIFSGSTTSLNYSLAKYREGSTAFYKAALRCLRHLRRTIGLSLTPDEIDLLRECMKRTEDYYRGLLLLKQDWNAE